jgi:hypothetical protein
LKLIKKHQFIIFIIKIHLKKTKKYYIHNTS